MIDFERSREAHIKNAATDWWINEKCIVGTNCMTYIVYVTDKGEIHIKELDAKCSLTPSRDICLCRINCNYADEHNAPSLCILESGRLIVSYTGHSQTRTLKYRMTERPYDITSFGPERVLDFGGSVSYSQVFENTAKHEVWLFTRVSSVTWEFRYSRDEGETWSESSKFLVSDAGGLFYFNVRKLTVPCGNVMPPTKEGFCERWFFALYGHPRISNDHCIRSGMFDEEGWLLTMDGVRTGMNLYGAEKNGAETAQMKLEELQPVCEAAEGETVRLLDVAPVPPFRVGYVSFALDDPKSITYYSATYRNGEWKQSEPIAYAGEFLAPGQTDGSQTYVGGMAYYYGVGEMGFHPADGGETDTNKIYIARADEESWRLESYVSNDCGATYVPEQVIRTIPKDGRQRKLWRPIVPIYAQDNMPVYWHEGTYTAHSGGWHSDAVMYIEYDL